MKKLAYLVVVALLAGCAGPAKEQTRSQPPLPPMPVIKKPLSSPKAAATAAPARRMLAAGSPGPVIPSWVFTNVSGSYAIDASTNLTDWWPAAEVYYATNITIVSDTVAKRPMIFYRVRPID